MSETPYLGYPFPVSSDLIADGAVNIEQAMEAVEDVEVVPSNSLAVAASWDSYPIGISMMQVTNSSDWPSSGVVLSIRRQGGDQTHQYWSGTSVANPYVAFRYGSSGGWSRWIILGGIGSIQEGAVGTAEVAVKANTQKTVKVTYPSGRFSAPPRVWTQYIGTHPEATFTSPSDLSQTYFNLNCYRTSDFTIFVQWMAIKLTTDLGDSAFSAAAAAATLSESGPNARAVCQNPGCENHLIPINVGGLTITDEETGETRTIDEAICGGCSQPARIVGG